MPLKDLGVKGRGVYHELLNGPANRQRDGCFAERWGRRFESGQMRRSTNNGSMEGKGIWVFIILFFRLYKNRHRGGRGGPASPKAGTWHGRPSSDSTDCVFTTPCHCFYPCPALIECSEDINTFFVYSSLGEAGRKRPFHLKAP